MSLAPTWSFMQRSARGMWNARAWLCAIAVRMLFIGALALWVQAGTDIFQLDQSLDVDAALDELGLGIGLCALAVLLAAQARVRWAAIALGGAHGGLAILLMDAAQML